VSSAPYSPSWLKIIKYRNSTAKAKKAQKEGKKYHFMYPYSPPNLGG
jgi:hypothetical protein